MTSDNCPVAESMMKPRTVMSVGITAGCDLVSIGGSAIIGTVCGLAMVGSVALIDKVCKIDDPVGAVSVHGIRVEPRIEEEGLDIYEHGETCYNS
ncbi:MAG: ammonium transporter [Bacteroidales bacterium]|nr:ammonium transporter [Bacteroidales bacterium]MBP5316633.1 ammonium transporter [Bacteroidales bacterium]